MSGITTSFCTSAKAELASGAHCFLATTSGVTGTTSNTSTSVTSVSSMAGIAVGMAVSGTGIASNTYVAAINSSSSLTLSIAATASNTGTALTFTGDVFNMALIKGSPTGTYGTGSVNYTDITGNSDETSGTGYTATGSALTNISPLTSGTTAYWQFSNPSWTSATFTTSGCMIYNTNARLGGTSGTNTTGAGRAMGVFDFGGTQSVSAGTLTVLFPSNTSSTSAFRLA